MKPAYHTTNPTPRALWAIDEYRSCMNASSPHWWAALLRASPGCVGFARTERAREVFGVYEAEV